MLVVGKKNYCTGDPQRHLGFISRASSPEYLYWSFSRFLVRVICDPEGQFSTSGSKRPSTV